MFYFDKLYCYFALHYFTLNPTHCKDNLPYNLGKRIIVFVSNEQKGWHEIKRIIKLVKGL